MPLFASYFGAGEEAEAVKVFQQVFHNREQKPLGFYVLLATYLLERFTSIAQIPGMNLIISLLMLGFTLITYLSVLFGDHSSSTEGLIFVFIPFWLYVGSTALGGLGLLIAWLSNRYPEGM